jgi:hypothetical protein
MLPVSHYLWRAYDNFFHQFTLLACRQSDWRRTPICLLAMFFLAALTSIISAVVRTVTQAKTPSNSKYSSIPPRLDFCSSSSFLILRAGSILLPTPHETVGFPLQSAPNNLLNPANYWHSCYQYRTTSGKRVPPFSSVHLVLASSDWRRISIVCLSICL